MTRPVIVCSGIAALVLGLLLMQKRGEAPKRLPATPPVQAEEIKKLDFKRVKKATQYFCAVDYHRESCFHYLSQCGEECFGYLNSASKRRVLKDYKNLRREHGLADFNSGLSP